MYQGPLPPASEFAKYDQVLPGAAHRILVVMESEQKHRHDLQQTQEDHAQGEITKIIDKDIQLAGRGQHYAMIFAIFALGCATYLGSLGHTWLAGTIATTTILGVISALLTSRFREKESRLLSASRTEPTEEGA
ncbi:MAG: DUF2335 domain-containing protein [Candidatus Lambdaproteobacteria bacterium]|nr:DUF2335 domain-containing protein [Candidatus Lambdaproteobacteria bacterium]